MQTMNDVRASFVIMCSGWNGQKRYWIDMGG